MSLPRTRAARRRPASVLRARGPVALALAAITGALLLRAAPARADGPVSLTWDAPSACPQAAFLDPLARYVGDRPHAGPPLRVQVRVRERAAGRWQLDLDITSDAARGARELTAESCATLADAAAFIVAQALADEAAPVQVPDAPPPAPPVPVAEPVEAPVEAPVEQPVEEPPVAPAATPAEPAPEVEPPPPARARRLRAAVRVGGGFRYGAVPGVSPGLALTLGLLGPRWRVDVVGRGELPTLARADAAPGVGASIGLWAVGARGCFVPRTARLEFPLCAGAELGQVIGRGVGVPDRGRAAVVWAAATVGPGLAWSPRPWLALVVQADLAIALIRHDFLIRGLPPLHRLGPVAVGGSLAVEWRFAGARP